MTTSWTDNPATSTTHIRTVHINELRNAVDKDLTAVGLPTYAWTDNPVTTTTHIRAVHFTEIRTAIQTLWTHAGQGTVPNWSVGSAPSPSRQISARDMNDLRTWVDQYDPASIIGAQWTNNGRNWAGKAGWDIELVYATNPSSGFDLTTVGGRVQSAHAAGRNVLVRVDYAPGQSMPPEDNDADRTTYVNFLESVCKTPNYNQNAWGYIIGNEYNRTAENGGGTPITPTWYARVFNGYNAPVGDTGNAYQFIKSYQPGAHVLVGPVGPYNSDAGSDDGSHYTISMPWLDYFNEVCLNIHTGATNKGLAVDGFAIHAYGRTGPDGTANGGANEPHNDVQGGGWATGAWAGFTVYKNWRDIIDDQKFPSAPIWITETNTDQGTNPPAQSNNSYPSGWYQQALGEISGAGARFWAVCWFVDVDYGSGWTNDSLTDQTGKCAQANNDFNNALTATTY